MRVLIINTSERIGGAAIAAGRLMESLKNNGIKAKMLVRDKQTDQISVVGLKRSWLQVPFRLWRRHRSSSGSGGRCGRSPGHRYLDRQPFPTVSSVRCRHCQHGNGHYLSSGISAGRRHSPALDQSGNAFIERHPEDTYFRQTGRLDNA